MMGVEMPRSLLTRVRVSRPTFRYGLFVGDYFELGLFSQCFTTKKEHGVYFERAVVRSLCGKELADCERLIQHGVLGLVIALSFNAPLNRCTAHAFVQHSVRVSSVVTVLLNNSKMGLI